MMGFAFVVIGVILQSSRTRMDFGVIALHFTIQALLLSILQNPQSVLCFAWSVVQSYTTSTATQGRFACGGCPPRDPLSQRGN